MYHLFADDIQLPHKSSSPEHFAYLLLDIQSCAESVRDWVACNMLRMNDNKTEIMPVGTKAKLKSVPATNLFSDSVWFHYTILLQKLETYGSILTAIFRPWINMSTFSADVFPELRRIGHLMCHVSVDAMKKLVLSFVLSRLDYSRQLFTGRSPGQQAASLAESTKQCSSSCPWQTRARPCKAFAQISALVASPSSD